VAVRQPHPPVHAKSISASFTATARLVPPHSPLSHGWQPWWVVGWRSETETQKTGQVKLARKPSAVFFRRVRWRRRELVGCWSAAARARHPAIHPRPPLYKFGRAVHSKKSTPPPRHSVTCPPSSRLPPLPFRHFALPWEIEDELEAGWAPVGAGEGSPPRRSLWCRWVPPALIFSTGYCTGAVARGCRRVALALWRRPFRRVVVFFWVGFRSCSGVWSPRSRIWDC
jgi:hypothetical protein